MAVMTACSLLSFSRMMLISSSSFFVISNIPFIFRIWERLFSIFSLFDFIREVNKFCRIMKCVNYGKVLTNEKNKYFRGIHKRVKRDSFFFIQIYSKAFYEWLFVLRVFFANTSDFICHYGYCEGIVSR